jgi:hypothetical protein
MILVKRAIVLAALILAVPAHARAQQAVDADLKKAKDMYVAGNVEGARQIFTGVINAKTQVTNAQKVEAYKYLGGSFAVLNKSDSASSYFIAALDYDPFATLDPKDFAAEERAAFDRARTKIFKVGIEPVKWAELDAQSTDPAKRTYTFRVVSTHLASLNVSLVNLRDSTQGRETFQTISQNDGARDLPWAGTINTLRADSGLYELKVTATDRLNPGNASVTETHKFRIDHVYAPLEDTLPSFVDVSRGGADTLTSRLSGLVPVWNGVNGLWIAGVAAAFPLFALSESGRMSGYKSHYGAGIALGLFSGGVFALWGANHRDDAAAVAENARRRQARADYNAGVRARNTARISRTILIVRPIG